MTVYVWARDNGYRVMSGIGTVNTLGAFDAAWGHASRVEARASLQTFRALTPAMKRSIIAGTVLLRGHVPRRPREVYCNR